MTVFLFHHQCIGVDSGLDLILEEEKWKCSTFFFWKRSNALSKQNQLWNMLCHTLLQEVHSCGTSLTTTSCWCPCHPAVQRSHLPTLLQHAQTWGDGVTVLLSQIPAIILGIVWSDMLLTDWLIGTSAQQFWWIWKLKTEMRKRMRERCLVITSGRLSVVRVFKCQVINCLDERLWCQVLVRDSLFRNRLCCR